jgi:hypothetical protein
MQRGSLIRSARKHGPDVWLFRWSEMGGNGRRVYRKQPNSRRRVTARNERATSPTNAPCPIHSPLLWRMGGKPRAFCTML